MEKKQEIIPNLSECKENKNSETETYTFDDVLKNVQNSPLPNNQNFQNNITSKLSMTSSNLK